MRLPGRLIPTIPGSLSRGWNYASPVQVLVVGVWTCLAGCGIGGDSRDRQNAGSAADGGVVWPTGRITLIAHTSPGGGADIMARELGRTLDRLYGVNTIVENRVGGSGAVATVYVARRAPRDGSTLLIVTPTQLITPQRSRGLPTHVEMTPIARLLMDPTVIFVSSKSPFGDMAELIEYAKRHPGALKWGIGSAGSLDHLVMQEIQAKAGISVTSVPHEGGGDAVLSVLGGHIDAGIGEPLNILPQLKAGNVRILAVFDMERLEEFPDVPAIGELGYEMSSQKFRGVWGPPGLSDAMVTAIADALERASLEEPFRTYWEDGGMERAFLRGPEFGAFLAEADEIINQFLNRN